MALNAKGTPAMSNRQTATLTIEAKIVHEKNGLAYYATRVKALEHGDDRDG